MGPLCPRFRFPPTMPDRRKQKTKGERHEKKGRPREIVARPRCHLTLGKQRNEEVKHALEPPAQTRLPPVQTN